ncbi:RNA-binding protein, partial [Streptomyces pathocidini]
MERSESGGGEAEEATGAAEVLDRPLPEGVRRRVVALTADAFGGLTMAELPTQLRQYARFTPTRRAKFAGNAMAAALESHTLFRQRIAEKLREAQPELTEALESGPPPAAADPLDQGKGNVATMMQAIKYAADAGAKVINISQ